MQNDMKLKKGERKMKEGKRRRRIRIMREREEQD
jgi:hypothetical protein